MKLTRNTGKFFFHVIVNYGKKQSKISNFLKLKLLVHGIDHRGAVGEELPDGLGTAGWAEREHSPPHHLHSGNTNFHGDLF